MNKNDKISETAIIVASLRALSNYESDERFNCRDNYAELFLPDDRRNALNSGQAREMIKKAIPKGMYAYVIARTKYFDFVFNSALKQDFKQIVFLGAGFDSRPYRFPALTNKANIFEVDAEATQEYKKSMLTNKTDALTKIKYVSTDFEEADLFRKLKKHGYNQTEKTLFLWEGVTFYLTSDSVLRMLKEIRENSTTKSAICFDFQTMRDIDELIKTGLKEESIKFGIVEGKINEFVQSNGFVIVEYLNSKMIEQRFMMQENGDLFDEIAPIMNFILIEHA